jgi:hypothetical protein
MSSLNSSDTSIAKSVLIEPIPASAEKTTVGKETDNNEMEENLIDYNEVDDIVNHSRGKACPRGSLRTQKEPYSEALPRTSLQMYYNYLENRDTRS